MEEVRKDGVYIDVCRRCRGVFLDAGELEELLYDSKPYREDYRDHKEYEYEYKKHHHSHKKKNKMKSVLGDLFDF